MKGIKWLDLLKFRGSYGRTGNMYANWEYVNTSDIGFDSRFLNNHIGFAFDWFFTRYKGSLRETDPPGTSGGGYPVFTNNASMKNSGFEATLNFNKSAGAFRFNADIIFQLTKI